MFHPRGFKTKLLCFFFLCWSEHNIRGLWSDMILGVTTRVFGEENPTPCTLVIVPGSVAITYRTHYRIISFPYNEIRVQNIIFTSETTRYMNLVQAPRVKRQVEILRSGS
jgi:hypothetical protein